MTSKESSADTTKTGMKFRDTSVMDALLLREETNYLRLNLPRTNEFIVNNRNQYLHVRSAWPSSIQSPYEVKGIAISLHGYGSHSNRPAHRYLAERFNNEQMAYITIDFAGHGYSEGHRGQVMSVNDIIDDALYLALAVFGEPSIVCSLSHQLSPDKLSHQRAPPVYVLGHSMGGGTAILLSYLLSYSNSNKLPVVSTPFYLYHRQFIQQYITPNFVGAAFVCPVVKLTTLPSWARELTLAIVADVFPYTIIPIHWGDDEDDKHPSWASKSYRRYVAADSYPQNPKGLTYGDSISFRSMNSILMLAEYVQLTLPEINFPFLLFHDPEDTIVPYSGSVIMMQRTTKVTSNMKRLVIKEKMLHDIVANDAVQCADEILSFFLSLPI